MELRCPANALHGIVSDDARGTIEVKCRGTWCGRQAGVIVLHKFDLSNGKIVETTRYRDADRVFKTSHKKEEAT